jgi:hypothetical protein
MGLTGTSSGTAWWRSFILRMPDLCYMVNVLCFEVVLLVLMLHSQDFVALQSICWVSYVFQKLIPHRHCILTSTRTLTDTILGLLWRPFLILGNVRSAHLCGLPSKYENNRSTLFLNIHWSVFLVSPSAAR